MSRDKQMELERWKMAESLAKNFHINGEGWDASDFEWAAHCLQVEGYRKASEVAREIIADLESIIEVDSYGEAKFNVIELLKIEKKYTEGGE